MEPIKSGDLCEVIGGSFESKSPNLGKIVTVRALKGEHSLYGRIWQCEGANLISEYGAVGSFADFASDWLRKIPPDQKKTKEEKEKELNT